MMEMHRAQEIFNSYGTIEVLHQGSPVWIEELDAISNTAVVTSTISDNGRRVEVPVKELMEGP